MKLLKKEDLGLGAGLVIALLLFFINPLRLEPQACKVMAVASLMVVWWVSEALPMPVVALVPMVLFPLFKIASVKDTALSYGDSIIFLFMGGFLLGLAIEKWNLHKRIALGIVSITGTSGDRIILGFILATGFISMWLSNTATTMMMFPIAASVIHVVKENHRGDGHTGNFALAIMLSIAYASNFGGIATIIGTPPNVAFVSFMEERYHTTVHFSDWMLICTPVAFLLMISLYWVLTKWLYPNRIASDLATRQHISDELARLGPLNGPEKRVLFIFCTTALLWITRDLINLFFALPAIAKIAGAIKLDDTIIAMMGGLALFLTPSGKGHHRTRILEWEDTQKMAWGILLLFGGGIALAGALEKAGLIKQLGQRVAGFSGSGGIVLVLVVTLVSIFVSEVMSNVAQVIVFSPVIAGISDALGMNPLLLGIPMTLAASCASMLPMGTPPNAIVFASGHIKLGQMLKTGFIMNLIAILLIVIASWWGLR